MDQVTENLARVRERIDAACGDGLGWEDAGAYELRGIGEPVPALRAVPA